MSAAAPSGHTVKAFDDDLKTLKQMITRMGGKAEAQLNMALMALSQRNADLAEKARRSDRDIDADELSIAEHSVRTLALRQPMAGDLREIVSAMKMSNNIERIGDYAASMAKRTIAILQSPVMPQIGAIVRMGRATQGMIKGVLDAYIERDLDLAQEIWASDAEVDEMYNSLFRELLTYMMEDPRSITACTHLLFIAKNIERIGDHATNMAETIHFLVDGTYLIDPRPKSDLSEMAMPQIAGDDTTTQQ